MEHIFWLIKDKIAGRCGPNTNMWDLNSLKANGFSAILSVNDGEAVHESMLSSLGIAYANIPMSPNAPVREGDREFCLSNLPKAMAFIRDNMINGPVLVHCRSGKDRTGLVLAAYLIAFEDFNEKDAMENVLTARPIAFSAEGWMDFGLEVLTQFNIDYLTNATVPE